MCSPEERTQPQEEGARQGRARDHEGGGTETKVGMGTTKVTAGCKTPEDKLKDLLRGENCFYMLIWSP